MKRPIGIVLLAFYLLATGAAGPIVVGVLLFQAMSLEYVNGFVVFVFGWSILMLVPAALSLVASYRVWVGHAHAMRLIRWAIGIRIVLSLFPPGFIGPLGVGPLALPLELAVLACTFTRRAKNYFVPPSTIAP